mmetsp:Transcript_39804/g.128323  ORF Transcript_39804/g.128323 Transcript_39804/m.128323 type:complete len:256 (+) Transcript_39804:835-1602(+)
MTCTQDLSIDPQDTCQYRLSPNSPRILLQYTQARALESGVAVPLPPASLGVSVRRRVVRHPRGDKVVRAHRGERPLTLGGRLGQVPPLGRHRVEQRRVKHGDAERLAQPRQHRRRDLLARPQPQQPAQRLAQHRRPCREEHGGVTRQRRARAVAQHVQHHRPERVRWGGAEDGVGGALGKVGALLVGEDERRARDERLERCETLVVEVEVDASMLVREQVARRVGALDRRGVCLVQWQEGGVVGADELEVVGVRP